MFDIKTYHKAVTVDEAISLLKENLEARPIAGGTDILIKLRDGKKGFSELVDINGLTELRFIKKDGDNNILIGSGTVFNDIIDSQLLKNTIPMLCDAAQSVGGPQVRNMATIGGNICNGVTSADSGPGLFALNAFLIIKGSSGERQIPIHQFYKGPGKVDLNPTEILTTIKITPENYQEYMGYYYKYAMRNAMDIATIGCAVNLKTANKCIDDFRIAYGVAGPVPIRCPKTEKQTIGVKISAHLLEQISKDVEADVNPRTSWRASKEFRMNIIKELSKRATEKALSRAGEACK
jgi:xanthine dehydrogenase FAD-binding subunit